MADRTLADLLANSPGSTPTGVEPIASVQGGNDVGLTVKQVADAARPGTTYLYATAVNFNLTASDAAVIPVVLPAGFARFMVSVVLVEGASASLSPATMSIWTGSGGTGVNVVADASTGVTSASANTNGNSASMTVINAATLTYSGISNLYIRIGTPKGSAATANVIIHIRPLP